MIEVNFWLSEEELKALCISISCSAEDARRCGNPYLARCLDNILTRLDMYLQEDDMRYER